MVSKVEGRGNVKKKIIVVPAEMNYLVAGQQKTAVSHSCLCMHKSSCSSKITKVDHSWNAVTGYRIK